MALFSDGSISTTDDLAAYDSAIMDVASTEGIDLTRKLALAQDELSVMLTSLLPEDQSCGLGNVVVTTPLRLWHTLRTLALAYEDAYYNQLNDRYQGKWQAFAERARWAQEQLMQAGAGFVTDPIPQAQPAVLTEAPAPQPAATYYATVTWVNASGQEGAPAELRSLEGSAGNSIQVRPVAPPANAAGWNVYVGFSPDAMYRQNDAPMATDQTWTFTDPALATETLPGNGQAPDFLRALPRILQRG
ncbi:MAG TPA: hypothetical protein VFA33_30245 [Bryobacteraceae bacterium]|nr:hypothetical protein [Bryobacteraceae bacterium]